MTDVVTVPSDLCFSGIATFMSRRDAYHQAHDLFVPGLVRKKLSILKAVHPLIFGRTSLHNDFFLV